MDVALWGCGLEPFPSVQVYSVNSIFYNLKLPSCVDRVVFLSFQGTYTANNSNILVTSIMTTNDTSLTCHTNSTTCCRRVHNVNGSNGLGYWLFPDGASVIQNDASVSDKFYWIRYFQVVRLYRRGDIQTPLGRYCCRIPDSGGVTRTACANLIGEGVQVI